MRTVAGLKLLHQQNQVNLTKASLTAFFREEKEWRGKKLWYRDEKASRENNYYRRTEEAFYRRLATSSSLCDPKKD